jgi:hypothetical protein
MLFQVLLLGFTLAASAGGGTTPLCTVNGVVYLRLGDDGRPEIPARGDQHRLCPCCLAGCVPLALGAEPLRFGVIGERGRATFRHARETPPTLRIVLAGRPRAPPLAA